MSERRARRAAARVILVAAVAVFLWGCGSATPTPSTSPSAIPSPGRTAGLSPDPNCPSGWAATPRRWGLSPSPVVRWFVGLGPGTEPSQIEAQKDYVKHLNACQSAVYVNLEIVPSGEAYRILKEEIALDNPPDIIGPIGIRIRDALKAELLDLAPLMKDYDTDLSDFEPAVLDFVKDAEGRQVGLPSTIYPGSIFYRKDLFAAAGLPEPPHRVGELYLGREWDWETLAWAARRLTVDTHGRTAVEPLFDRHNAVQHGFAFEWADARRIGSAFGGGSLVASDGRTAQIPAAWARAWKWYYDAMWTSGFAFAPGTFAFPEKPVGTWAFRGRVAMEPCWPWSFSTLEYLYGGSGQKAPFGDWDIAVMPADDGRTWAPMDVQTFAVARTTVRPYEAYQVMLAIMANPELMAAYGGMPAHKSMQADYFRGLDARLDPVFPGNEVDWSVLAEMSKYPAVPSHEADMPGYDEASQALTSFLSRLETGRDLDVDSEIENLRRELQAIFDKAAPSPSP